MTLYQKNDVGDHRMAKRRPGSLLETATALYFAEACLAELQRQPVKCVIYNGKYSEAAKEVCWAPVNILWA